MIIKTIIPVTLHKSANRHPFNSKAISIELDKTEFFKYAIYQLEVPSRITESNFNYLQSKVPALETLNSDYLELTSDRIINHATDDRTKQSISELAGVAVGLKYTTLLLNTSLHKFSKIGVPIKGKYLDYEVIVEERKYELETKGTVKQYFKTMVDDIINKKKTTSDAYLRFGAIAAVQGSAFERTAECVIVDDPPEDKDPVDVDYFANQLNYYAIYLSFILDSKYYNWYISGVIKKSSSSPNINKRKFFARYEFHGNFYYGECFDYRLIQTNVEVAVREQNSRDGVFNLLTTRVGVTKFFIGLNEDVINAINKRDRTKMENYRSEKILEDGAGFYRFLDLDGILIIKSTKNADEQLEKLFTEQEVEKRLNLYIGYLRGQAHDCGSPCESPGLEGKPCEIRTFREACHWHR